MFDGVMQSFGEFPRQCGGIARRLGPSGEPLCERLAADVFHHDEGLRVPFVESIDLHDPGVAEPGRRLGLGPHPQKRFFGSFQTAEHLHGDASLQARVERLIDDPHPPLPDTSDDLQPRDVRQGRWAWVAIRVNRQVGFRKLLTCSDKQFGPQRFG
jgi:hypothetical protein